MAPDRAALAEQLVTPDQRAILGEHGLDAAALTRGDFSPQLFMVVAEIFIEWNSRLGRDEFILDQIVGWASFSRDTRAS